MIAPVFVDTSAWFAVCDRRDANHDRAAAFLRATQRPLMTSNLVFAEALSLATKRLGKDAAIRFGTGLRGSGKARIIHVDAKMEEAAWAAFERYSDKEWDFIDCASFVLMDSLKTDLAFTFDAHFAQRGLTVVPGQP